MSPKFARLRDSARYAPPSSLSATGHRVFPQQLVQLSKVNSGKELLPRTQSAFFVESKRTAVVKQYFLTITAVSFYNIAGFK